MAEFGRITEFYAVNPDNGNAVRDPMQVLSAVKDGSYFLIENQEGDLRAASANFYHLNKFVEAGGTRVLDNGFGFQKIFHWVRIVQFFLFREDGHKQYFSIVTKGNEKSISNTKKAGFTEWTPGDDELAAIGKYSLDGVPFEKVYFCITQENLVECASGAAKELLRLKANPIIPHRDKKVSQKASIFLDIPLLKSKEEGGCIELVHHVAALS